MAPGSLQFAFAMLVNEGPLESWRQQAGLRRNCSTASPRPIGNTAGSPRTARSATGRPNGAARRNCPCRCAWSCGSPIRSGHGLRFATAPLPLGFAQARRGRCGDVESTRWQRQAGNQRQAIRECGSAPIGRRQRGAALILVMWLLVLLTAVIGAFAQSARIESMQAHQLRSSLIAREAARAGIEYAALRMLYPDVDRRWVPGWARKYASSSSSDAKLEIRIVDESGKVDLNRRLRRPSLETPCCCWRWALDGPAATCRSRRRSWTTAIPTTCSRPAAASKPPDYSAAGLPYGPKNRPFEAVSELQRVFGMNFSLYQKLAPYVTVYASGDPTPTFAQPPVLQALGMSPAGARICSRPSARAGSQVLPGAAAGDAGRTAFRGATGVRRL